MQGGSVAWPGCGMPAEVAHRLAFAVLGEAGPLSAFDEVMAMRRYLLVLGMGLLTLNEELDLEPVNYLVGRQEQERGEVVVLAVVANRPVKLSPLELLLGAVGYLAGADWPWAVAAPRRSSSGDSFTGRLATTDSTTTSPRFCSCRATR